MKCLQAIQLDGERRYLGFYRMRLKSSGGHSRWGPKASMQVIVEEVGMFAAETIVQIGFFESGRLFISFAVLGRM